MYHDYQQLAIPVSLSVYSGLASAGIAAPVIFVITNLVVSFSSYPDYKFTRDSISSLALTPLGWVQTIGFMIMGLLIEVFIIGLLLSIRGWFIHVDRKFTSGAFILGIFGFGLLLIGAFHTDPTGNIHTLEGTIHGIVSRMLFWLFPIATLLIAPCLRKQPYWKALFLYTIIAGAVALALLIVGIFLPSGFSWFGLYERILTLDELMWVEIMAIWLLRLSLRRMKKLEGQ
jgi:hypothetical protein